MRPSIDYSIDASAGIVRLEYTGDATFEEWSSTLKAIFADAAYCPGFDFLIDRRRASAPTAETMHRMIAFIDRNLTFCEGSRWAIVTYSLADYGMGRMAQALASDHPTTLEIFTDLKEGLDWLAGPTPSDVA